ncbi:hypothetical protein EON65_15705 [archaeon]|nr:MAG: hypothetical protein EON65_15705 [archaeon]
MNAINEGISVTPYIAIPWISGNEEMEYICRVIQRASEDYAQTVNIRTPTQVKMGLGALIEVPRACLQAEKIIKNPYTDFMLFNSDSLTEMVFGMSRQDQHRFMVGFDLFVILKVHVLSTSFHFYLIYRTSTMRRISLGAVPSIR